MTINTVLDAFPHRSYLAIVVLEGKTRPKLVVEPELIPDARSLFM